MAKVNKSFFKELGNGARGGFKRGVQNGPDPAEWSKRGGAKGRNRVEPKQSKAEARLAARREEYRRMIAAMSPPPPPGAFTEPGSLNYH